jgi:hypothetical protein
MHFFSKQHVELNLRPLELTAAALHSVMKKMPARWRCWPN